MNETAALIERRFTPGQISFLKKLPLEGWQALFAEAARKSGGKMSFTPDEWVKINKTPDGISKEVGRNLAGYCGAACWLYAAVKNLGAKEEHALRYYEDAEHITVITPSGSEIDVTAPQQAFTGSGNFKKAKNIRRLGFTEIEENAKTMRRFGQFAEDFAGIMQDVR